MGTSTQIKNPFSKHVIFFDGHCNLCNASVDFVLKKDKEEKFLFDSLQSDYAVETFNSIFPKDTDSIIVWTKSGDLLLKSNAALLIASELGGWLRLFIIFKVLPLLLRDAIYAFLAKNRYKWFGRKNTCRLPSSDERQRFLEGYQNS